MAPLKLTVGARFFSLLLFVSIDGGKSQVFVEITMRSAFLTCASHANFTVLFILCRVTCSAFVVVWGSDACVIIGRRNDLPESRAPFPMSCCCFFFSFSLDPTRKNVSWPLQKKLAAKQYSRESGGYSSKFSRQHGVDINQWQCRICPKGARARGRKEKVGNVPHNRCAATFSQLRI